MSRSYRLKTFDKLTIILLILTLAPFWFVCETVSKENRGDRVFQIQEMAIEASIVSDFQLRLLNANSPIKFPSLDNPAYLVDAFINYTAVSGEKTGLAMIRQKLWDNYEVELKPENGRYEAYAKTTQESLHIYDRKDFETVQALLFDCSQWREAKGRLACEFDGGSDYGMKPYTAILFNVAYLKYESQKLGYKNGQYQLIEGNEPAIVLNVDLLLSRNAIARVVSYQLLTQTSSLLAENFKRTGQKLPVDEWGWSPIGYDDLNKYYVQKSGEWQNFAKGACKTEITFDKTGFGAKNTETGEKITFPRDDDLLNEALKELNYYKEKCDFVNYFQVENYPMFLLSILRLYDVNLELDKATNKYVIAPGPTDPQKFFNIVAEFTFVNDPSDTEYLKKHLTSWETSKASATDEQRMNAD
jgi:hypothetical protein